MVQAASTKAEQQRWLEALQAELRPHRLSCHSSERTLHTAFTTAAANADYSSVCVSVATEGGTEGKETKRGGGRIKGKKGRKDGKGKV